MIELASSCTDLMKLKSMKEKLCRSTSELIQYRGHSTVSSFSILSYSKQLFFNELTRFSGFWSRKTVKKNSAITLFKIGVIFMFFSVSTARQKRSSSPFSLEVIYSSFDYLFDELAVPALAQSLQQVYVSSDVIEKIEQLELVGGETEDVEPNGISRM
jgi:hypothetical protein